MLESVASALKAGTVVPYLGPEVLTLSGDDAAVPASVPALAQALTSRVAVPGRIKHDLWASAQYIESRKHRVTLRRAMEAIFGVAVQPTDLHAFLAELKLPMIVDLWYDAAMRDALTQAGTSFGEIQGVTRSEHREIWTLAYDAVGEIIDESLAGSLTTLLYKPWGGIRPAGNFLISDSDFVEVLTEIDIQSPIPRAVQERRTGRGFLFIGCRFDDQTQRTFARQIMKRSSDQHWAVINGTLTENEQKFLDQQNIQPINLGLAEAAKGLAA